MPKSENSALTKLSVSNRAFLSVSNFKQALVDNLYYTRGQDAHNASLGDVYTALAYTVRDYLVDRWHSTVNAHQRTKPKFVYYLSAEYLPGQQITKNMLYTGTTEIARQALAELGYDLDVLVAQEVEPALGNGGLGRLAACYFDSLATLDIPSISYGIHYEFGIFTQSFKDGWQQESPDDWLYYGNPWEFPHPDESIEIFFGGWTEHYADDKGRYRVRWVPGETVLSEPSHILIPGYGTRTVNMLRLWRAKASKAFDFQLFDVGDYARAAEQKISSENITKVLYPNDNTPQGKELRLKQEYFFVSASLQDILRRFLSDHSDWEDFPEQAVIQLNDTHPVLAIPELMRLLVDVHDLLWERAWRITERVFAYTCHTLLPEALERWPVGLFQRMLPRHMEIIYEINRRFLEQARKFNPNDLARLGRMSIIEEGPERQVRMAFLAAVGSFSINGVAELHSELLQKYLLHDFYEMWPERFNNKTNGVTPRRFMRLSNPRLSTLISSRIGEDWVRQLDQLKELEAFASEPAFQQEWMEIKHQNKIALAKVILERTSVVVDPSAMFDVMVKRLHEYKRQLLKALHIITLFNRLRDDPTLDMVPRVFIFGAKAAPGYHQAKLIIRLVNGVGETINRDPRLRDRLKVAFLPNFNVTLGEKIYPAAELSEQISLAGKEASGTGNMKFALNGALTIGTLDGANIEIRERVGAENFFLFGLNADEVVALRTTGYQPRDYYYRLRELKQAIDLISSGQFSNGDRDLFRPLVDSLLNYDTYFLLADYASYIEAQGEVDRVYRDQTEWTHKSILNTARSGFFSSDRAIQQYCEDIWKVSPVKVIPEKNGVIKPAPVLQPGD